MPNPRPALDEVLRPDLNLVICGTAASKVSAAKRQYYAGPGNRFWEVLAATGLTPHLLDPSEFREVLKFGIGLTDVVKDQSGMDASITFGGQGASLETRIQPLAPRFLCFNGKRAAMEALDEKRVSYGLQSPTFGGTHLFVAPSTSAAARRWWDTGPWEELAERVLSPTWRPACGHGPN